MASVRISMPAEVADIIGALAVQGAENRYPVEEEDFEDEALWKKIFEVGWRLRKAARRAAEEASE